MITPKETIQFVEEYSYFYSSENKYNEKGREIKQYIDKKHKKLGKNVKLGTSVKDVEDIATNSVFPIAGFDTPCQEICWKHIAWKAGRLEFDAKGGLLKEYEKDSDYHVSSDGRYAWDGCNGYGNPIELINEYLNSINSVCERVSSDLLKDNNKVYEQLKKAYKEILNLQKQNNEQTVKYFGPVYILTLIYFLSKGKFPIYDKYAHKAAKALFFNANPKDVTVETSLDKNDIDKVLTLYCEYCWLLTQLFTSYSITREQDQALWVYGHSKEKFPVSDNMDNEKRMFDF